MPDMAQDNLIDHAIQAGAAESVEEAAEILHVLG